MSELRRVLHERRRWQQKIAMDRLQARAAMNELQRQYRVMPALPLGIAAAAGFVWGRHGHRWRPPPGVLLLTVRGVIGLGRSLF